MLRTALWSATTWNAGTALLGAIGPAKTQPREVSKADGDPIGPDRRP